VHLLAPLVALSLDVVTLFPTAYMLCQVVLVRLVHPFHAWQFQEAALMLCQVGSSMKPLNWQLWVGQA